MKIAVIIISLLLTFVGKTTQQYTTAVVNVTPALTSIVTTSSPLNVTPAVSNYLATTVNPSTVTAAPLQNSFTTASPAPLNNVPASPFIVTSAPTANPSYGSATTVPVTLVSLSSFTTAPTNNVTTASPRNFSEAPTTGDAKNDPDKLPVTTAPSSNVTAAPTTGDAKNDPNKLPVTTAPSRNVTAGPTTGDAKNDPEKLPVTTAPSSNVTTALTTGDAKNDPEKLPVTTAPSSNVTVGPTTGDAKNDPDKLPVTTAPSSNVTAAPTTADAKNDPDKLPVTTAPPSSVTAAPATDSSYQGTINALITIEQPANVTTAPIRDITVAPPTDPSYWNASSGPVKDAPEGNVSSVQSTVPAPSNVTAAPPTAPLSNVTDAPTPQPIVNVTEAPTTNVPTTAQSIVNVTNAPTTNAPTTAGPTSSYDVVIVQAVFKLTKKAFQTTFLEKSSNDFKALESSISSEMFKDLGSGSARSIFAEMFRPGSVQATVNIEVYKKDQNSVPNVENTVKNKITSGYIGTLEVDKSEYSVGVKDLNCQRPVVTITNLASNPAKPTAVKKSQVYNVQSETQLRCNDSKADFRWKVWKLKDTGSGSYSVDGSAMIVNVNGTSEWTFKERELEIGLYMVVLKVKMKKNNAASSSVNYLSIVQSPIVAQIEGGSKVTRGAQRIKLDASPSRDLDLKAGDYTGMTFTWFCKKKSEVFPKGPLPIIVTSAPSTNTGCFNTGIGKFSQSGRVIEIDGSLMQVGQSYTIKLEVESGVRKESFEQEMDIVNGDPPQLSVTCLINCGSSTNPSSRLKVVSKCIKPEETCDRPLKYRWSLTKKNGPVGPWETVPEFSDMLSTEIENPDAVIEKDKLEPGKKYQLTVTASGPKISDGISSYIFETNKKPRDGSCEVSPTTGIALKTDFKMTCKDWKDKDLPLQYQFYYVPSPGLTSVISYGLNPSATSKLPVGTETGNKMTIYVHIIDSMSTFEKVAMKITVNLDTSLNNEKALEKTLDDSTDEIEKLLNSGDVKQATQFANAALDTMFASKDTLNTTKKSKIIGDIVDKVIDVKANNLQTLTQVTSVIGRGFSNPEDVSSSLEAKTIKALNGMTTLLATKSEDTSASEDGLIDAGGENLALCLGNLMRSSSSKAKFSNTDQKDSQKSVQVTETSTKLVNTVGESLLNRKVIGEKPSIVKTSSLSLILSRQTPDKLKGTKLEEGGSSFELPSKEVLGNEAETSKFVDSQVTVTKFNPYTWDRSADKIKSSVTSLVLRNNKKKEIVVKDLTTDIDMTIVHQAPNKINTEQSFLQPNSIRNYKFNVEYPGMGLLLTITPEKNGEPIKILVRQGKKPTSDKYDFSANIPDLPACGHSLPKACKKSDTQVFISAKVLEEKGVYYVGLLWDKSQSNSRKKRSCFDHGRQKRSLCVEPKEAPKPANITKIPTYNPDTDMNYTLSTQLFNCLYWSGKEWTSKGCKAGPSSSKTELQCLCNHLTFFGGSLLIESNPIDFDVVFENLKTLHDNVAVLATIVVFFLVYLVIAIFARRADRRDMKKYGPPIAVSSRAGGFQYEVIIQTGVWRNSGTTSNVAIEIHGYDAASDQIILSSKMDQSRLMFATGSTDTFIISLPVSLGMLEYVNIRHDNSGTSPSWWLKDIIIKDMQTAQSWLFLYEDWLALEKGDGRISKYLLPLSSTEMRSFNYNFNNRTTKKFTEDHLWLSVVTKPPYSNYTRLQRATCCLTVLFSAMVVNAMFYKTSTVPDPRVQVGPLKFSMNQVIIGIYSSLMVIPVGLGTVFLFKNSRAAIREPGHKGLLERFTDCLCKCCRFTTKQNKISDSQARLTANDYSNSSSEPVIQITNEENLSDMNENGNVIMKRQPERFSLASRLTKETLLSRDLSNQSEDSERSLLQEHDSVTESMTTVRTTSEQYDNKKTNGKKSKFSWVESIREILTENFSSKDDDNGFSLPHACVYASWIICIVTVLVSASFIFIYSLMWGKEISNQWLSSILISFCEDLFVIQPIKIFLVAILLSCVIRKKSSVEEMSKLKSPRKSIQVTNNNSDEASGSTLQMNTIDDNELEKARDYQRKEDAMFSFVRELMLYGMFLILLTIVCYGNRSYLGYTQTNTIRNDFSNFSKISTGEKYWKWIESQFTESAFAGSWYNGQNEPIEAYIGNKRSLLVGMPRIRQLRIKPDSCVVPKKVRKFFTTCYEEYSIVDEDNTSPYLPGWKPFPGSNNDWANISKLCPKPWRYSTAKELYYVTTWGYHHLYGGGGYVADLGYRNSTRSFVTSPLRKNSWINQRTRALILEFAIFNPSTNQISSVAFYYEVFPTLFGYPFPRIETMTIYGSETGSHDFFLICKLLFIFFVLFYLAREAVKVYKFRKVYFKTFWNFFEIFQIIMAAAVVVCYLVKEKMILEAVQQLKINPFITVNFQPAIMWKYAEDVCLSIAVFIATVKILRMLRFNPHIIIFNSSLKRCRQTLISFSLILFIIMFGFAILGHLLLGTSMTQYRTLRQSLYTQILVSLGQHMSTTELRDASFFFGNAMDLIYKMLMAFYFVNFYIAVINDSYEDTKTNTDYTAKEFEMSGFIVERLVDMFFKNFRKVKNESVIELSDVPRHQHTVNLEDENDGKEEGLVDTSNEKDEDVESMIKEIERNSEEPVTSLKIETISEAADNTPSASQSAQISEQKPLATAKETLNQVENNGKELLQVNVKLERPGRKLQRKKNTSKSKSQSVKNLTSAEAKQCEEHEKYYDIFTRKGDEICQRAMILAKEDKKEENEFFQCVYQIWLDLVSKQRSTEQEPSGVVNQGYEDEDVLSPAEEEYETYESTDESEEEEEADKLWESIEQVLKEIAQSKIICVPEHLRFKYNNLKDKKI